jgi:hypothetical protein
MAEENLPGPGLAISDKAAQRGGRLRSEKLVQGFTVMHPDKSAAVIGLLDLRPGITPEDFEKALEELDVDKVLDANRTARVRTEQGYIRQALLGGRIDAECAVCGHRFPVDLLVRAHIKPRSCCNDAEKRGFPCR